MKTKIYFITLLTFSLFLLSFSYSFAQWQWQNPLPQGNSLQSVTFIEQHQGWAVGTAGTILHTVDGGNTWEVQTSGTVNDLFDVCFTDLYKGWAVGQGGTILFTSDGGDTWEEQFSGTMYDLFGVCFTDPDNGWVVEALIFMAQRVLSCIQRMVESIGKRNKFRYTICIGISISLIRITAGLWVRKRI